MNDQPTAGAIGDPAPIAVIGDVHLQFTDEDVRWFNASDYGLLLFVGDLAGYRRGPEEVARRIAQLSLPTLLIPGNHDGVSLPHLLAETLQAPRALPWISGDQPTRVRRLEQALGAVPLCGYSLHEFELSGRAISIIAARPHSQGGSQFAFARHLSQRFAVESLAQSSQRLCALVDAAQSQQLLFLAHSGPAGLGTKRDDIWGCDFRPQQGDFGDSDLTAAISYAKGSGREVLAVVAGHMHHRLRGGGQRCWQLRQADTLYVNAARVPRIFGRGEQRRRHHVRLEWRNDRFEASERLVVDRAG